MSKETLTRTARNSAWLLSGQAGAQVLTLGFTVLVARGLGTVAFGQFAFGAAVASFLTIAAAFGLDLLVIRDLARDHSRTAETFSTAIVARLLLWLVGLAVFMLFLAVRGADGTAARVLVLLSLSGLMTLFANCGSAVMASRELFWPRVAAETVGNLLKVAMAYAAVRAGLGVVGVAGAVLVSSAIAAVLSVGYTVRRYRIRPVVIPWNRIVEMLRRAAPFGVAGLVFSLYFRLHLVMLSILRGDFDVGLYGAAFKAVDAWVLLPGSLVGAAYPLLARSFGTDQTLFERTHQLLARGLLAIGLPITALIAANSKQLIVLVYGTGYLQAHRALAVLAFFLPAAALNYVLGTALYAGGHPKAVLRAELAGLALGLGCGMALIPRWGIVGAAAAAVLMEAGVVAFNAWSVRRLLGIAVQRAAWLPALPISIGLGILSAVVSFPVVGELLTGLLLFALLFFVMGGVRAEDRIWLATNVRPGPLRSLLSRTGLLAEPIVIEKPVLAGESRKAA